MTNQVIPEAAGHAVDPTWSALYDTYKCKTCGVWAYQLHGGEWKHGGAKRSRNELKPTRI